MKETSTLTGTLLRRDAHRTVFVKSGRDAVDSPDSPALTPSTVDSGVPRAPTHLRRATPDTGQGSAEQRHLPVHASSYNQLETPFSIVQRRVIETANVTDLQARRLATPQPRNPAS